MVSNTSVPVLSTPADLIVLGEKEARARAGAKARVIARVRKEAGHQLSLRTKTMKVVQESITVKFGEAQ